MDDSSEDKKHVNKKCVNKRSFKFENYNNCSEATKLANKKRYLEKKFTIDSF